MAVLGALAVLVALMWPGAAQSATREADSEPGTLTQVRAVSGSGASGADVARPSERADGSAAAQAGAAVGLLALGFASVVVAARRREPLLAE